MAAEFVRDKERVVKETGVARVSLVGLGSGRCIVPESIRESFDHPLLTWRDLAAFFGADPLLIRADDVYETPVFVAGRSSLRKMTGQEIVDSHMAGKRFFVGREGGVQGPPFLRRRGQPEVAREGWAVSSTESTRTTHRPYAMRRSTAARTARGSNGLSIRVFETRSKNARLSSVTLPSETKRQS
jgi:hypothetical protein